MGLILAIFVAVATLVVVTFIHFYLIRKRDE
jgi:hypothetical protein